MEWKVRSSVGGLRPVSRLSSGRLCIFPVIQVAPLRAAGPSFHWKASQAASISRAGAEDLLACSYLSLVRGLYHGGLDPPDLQVTRAWAWEDPSSNLGTLLGAHRAGCWDSGRNKVQMGESEVTIVTMW